VVLTAAYVGALALLVLLAVGWWYLLVIRPLMKMPTAGGPTPSTPLLALQLSLVTTTLGFFLGDGGAAFLNFFLPFLSPLVFLFWLGETETAVLYHYQTAVWGGAAAGLATVGCLCLISMRALKFALFPAFVIAGISAVHLAEARSQDRMSSRADQLGATCLARHSFSQSLRFAGEEFQWDLHASARIDGTWHGWSYAQDDFYLIPDRAPKDGNGLQAECEAQEGVS
jgi:hypothetical protein